MNLPSACTARLLPVFVFVVFSLLPCAAGAVALDLLVGGQSLECGNLRFSRFTYDRGSSPAFAEAANVAVNCVAMPSPGIQFDGLWSGTRNTGAEFQARLTYQLNVLNASAVSFARLMANLTTTEDDVARVGEVLFPLPGDCPT